MGLMLLTGVMAAVWVTYKVIRRESISTDHIPDQIGLALLIIATLMMLSRLPNLFFS